MTLFNQQSLANLTKQQDSRCISIYLPTHTHGKETRQDPIRLKNLLDDVERQLETTDMRTSDIRDQLAPVRELLDDHDYWQHQTAGLSLFGCDGHWQTYQLPDEPPEIAAVGNSFHILPLLPLTGPYGLHYVLAVSLKQARLFLGSRRGLVEWKTDKLQFGMKEALGLDLERELQLHSHRPAPQARKGTSTGVYHGHEDDDAKRYILEYFREVDDVVRELLSGETAPLIFAGVDYLFPIYQQANKYPQLMDQPITGNFDDADPDELQQPAWDIVRPHVEEEKRTSLAQLQQALGTGHASIDMTELLPSAYNGRIERLFVRPRQTYWGRYEQQTGELKIDNDSTAVNDDLVNLLAIETLNTGGTVYAIDEESNEKWDVAATFRFPAVEPQANLSASTKT